MSTPSRLFAVFPFLVAIACAPKTETAMSDTAMAPANDPAVVRQAIDSANARFVAAFAKADTATMMLNYTDDAVVMLAGMPAMRGRAETARGFAQFMSAATISNPKFTTDDVIVSGDIAVESGRYEMTVQEKGKKAVTDKGKYITVWKKQADGSWKIIRDIANSDAAPTG